MKSVDLVKRQIKKKKKYAAFVGVATGRMINYLVVNKTILLNP